MPSQLHTTGMNLTWPWHAILFIHCWSFQWYYISYYSSWEILAVSFISSEPCIVLALQYKGFTKWATALFCFYLLTEMVCDHYKCFKCMVNCTRESTWAWHFLFCKLSVFSTCHYPCTQRWWWGEELAQLMTEGEKERDSPAAIWRLQKAGDVFHFTSTGLRSRNDYVDPSSRADINCSSASYKERKWEGKSLPPSLPPPPPSLVHLGPQLFGGCPLALERVIY